MLRHDFRHALRWLRANPGFTAAALFVLALGIGSVTATFTVVHAVLLRPLPFHEPDRIIRIWSSPAGRDLPFFSVSPADAADWRARATTLSHVAPYERQASFTVTGGGSPESIVGTRVSRELLELLGVAPVLGRWFSNEEDRPGSGDRVALISHGVWQRRFGGRPDVIGQPLRLDGEPRTVVGVMPPAFAIPNNPAEVWLPMRLMPDPSRREGRSLRVLARLRDGVSIEQATGELERIAASLAAEHPATNHTWTVTVRPLFETVVSDGFRTALLAVAGAVALVLLIACANVASLLLSRAAGRTREMAVRTAMGASRGALVRQMLVESLLLAACGGTLGVLMAMWGLDALRALALITVPRADDIEMRPAVILFAVVMTTITAVVFGMVPAIGASRARLEALRVRELAGGGTASRVRDVLVVAEVALAVVLLAGAGLMARSFMNLQGRDVGFDADRLLLLDVTPPASTSPLRFYPLLMERLAALPGVAAVGGGSRLPFAGANSANVFAVEGRTYAQGDQPDTDFRVVTDDYFRTLGIPIVRGRAFTAADSAGAPAAIVSAGMAARYFPDADPLGQRIRLGDAPWAVIVGVAGDARYRGLGDPGDEVRTMLYVPHASRPEEPLTIAMRTDVAPGSLAAAVRSAVAAAAPAQPIVRLETMSALLAAERGPHRFNTTVLGAFAWVALVLAAAGLWALISHAVARRTHEIGVRVALGASRRDIIRATAGRGLVLAGGGIALGLAAAAGATRVLQAVLFDTSPTDPATFAVIASVFLAVAAAASLLPARRALRIDPAEALRLE